MQTCALALSWYVDSDIQIRRSDVGAIPRLTYILVHNSCGTSATAALVENVDSLDSDIPRQFGWLTVPSDRHLWLWVTTTYHVSKTL